MLTYDYVGPQNPEYYCLVLHGLGDSMEGWKGVVPELGLSQIGFIFVNAPDAYFTGYSWFPYPGINADPDDADATVNGIRRSRDLLEESIQFFLEKYAITADKLFLMGFSQGCVMVIDYALRSDQLFAGVLGMSGACLLIDEFPDSFGGAVKNQNIFMCHGRYDDVVPINATRLHVKQLQNWEIPVEWREYDVQHGVDPYEELPDIKAWFLNATG